MKKIILSILLLSFSTTMLYSFGNTPPDEEAEYYQYVAWKADLERVKSGIKTWGWYNNLALGGGLIGSMLSYGTGDEVLYWSSILGGSIAMFYTQKEKIKMIRQYNDLRYEGQQHNWLVGPQPTLGSGKASVKNEESIDIDSALNQIKRFYDSGLISEEEYKKKRSEILLEYTGNN